MRVVWYNFGGRKGIEVFSEYRNFLRIDWDLDIRVRRFNGFLVNLGK